jgi:membrane-bound lytic murein transglycosylase B
LIRTLIAGGVFLWGCLSIPLAWSDYLARPEVRDFVDQVVEEDGLDRDWVLQLLASAQYQQSIIDLISRPAERVLNWG